MMRMSDDKTQSSRLLRANALFGIDRARRAAGFIYSPTSDPARRQFGAAMTLNYPGATLGRLLDQSAQRYPDNPALTYCDLHWSYRELLEQVNRVAGGLAQLGVRRGDHVLLALPNCPEFVATFLAAQKLGAIVVNAGPLIGADDLRKLYELTQPTAVVGLDLQATMLKRAAHDRKQIHWVWVSLQGYQTMWRRFGYRIKLWRTRDHDARAVRHTDRQIVWPKLLAQAPSRPPTIPITPDDVAVLQPTGGTTGVFKVAKLTHRNLTCNALQTSVWGSLQQGQERVLGVLPMFHVYGLMTCLVAPIFNAALMLPVTRLNMAQLLEIIHKHQPTVTPLVPAIIEMMCDHLQAHPNHAICDVIHRSMVTSGAAPLTPDTAARFEQVVGAPIVQGYGLTEASPVTHANPAHAPRAGSIGLPLPDTLVRLIDLDDPSREAAPGEPGEMLVSGPQIFDGYYHNDAETAKVIDVDAKGRRWLHTGDVVRIDRDGYCHVVDRRKHMIIRGGLKVWPGKVEEVLKSHAMVRDVAVIGRFDAVHTETVTAVIVLKQSKTDTDALVDELCHFCRKRLAPYETPSRFEFVEQLPRTGLGKLQKHAIASDSPNTISRIDRNMDRKELEADDRWQDSAYADDARSIGQQE